MQREGLAPVVYRLALGRRTHHQGRGRGKARGFAVARGMGDHYTFAGEYPWLPELEPNGLDEIRIPLPPVKRERVQTTTKWFRDGKEINLGAIRALLVSDDVNMFKGTKRSWLAYAAEQRQKLKITFKAIKETVVDAHDIEEIKALRTVRDYSWEGYHTTTAVGRNFSTGSRPRSHALCRFMCVLKTGSSFTATGPR